MAETGGNPSTDARLHCDPDLELVDRRDALVSCSTTVSVYVWRRLVTAG